MQAFRCLDGKVVRPRMLGCILLYTLLAVGLLQLLKKPLALLLQPTTNFETVYISNSNIPKIIHQTYANTSIPDHWKPAQRSCLDLHPDYEYKVSKSSACPRRSTAETDNMMIVLDG